MQLQTASRKQAKIKLAIQGPASSGKTYSALLLAYFLLTLPSECQHFVEIESGV